MKIHEFKLRLINFANNILDSFFKGNSLADKGMSTIAKYVIKKKIDDLDDFLMFFTNKDKEIDAEEFVEYITDNMVGEEGLMVNFRDYINPESVLYNIIPNKTLIVKKEDFNCLYRDLFKKY
jgi:hypothetical protein